MNIGVVILVTGGAIGILCSLLSIWVLFRKSRWNGYNRLILMLTVAQLIYDASVVMVVFPGIFMDLLYISLRSMSGLCATFITNVLSGVIVYTAWTLRSYDIRRKTRWIATIIIIPSSICGALVSYTLHYYPRHPFEMVSQLYYWSRIGSILFNIICYFILVYKLKIVKSLPAYKRGSDPLHILASRYKYYPMLQVFTRAFVSYYEFKYGFNYHLHSYFHPAHQFALILYVITLPAAGIGFFLIFMRVSPGAASCLRNDLIVLYRLLKRCVCLCCVGDDDEDLKHTDEDSLLRANLLPDKGDSSNGYATDRLTFMSERPLYPHLHEGSPLCSGGGNVEEESESHTSSEHHDATGMPLPTRRCVSGASDGGLSSCVSGAGYHDNDEDSFLSWNNLTQSSSSRSADLVRYGNTPRRPRQTDADDTYSDWSEGELSTEISRLYTSSKTISSTLPVEDRHTMYSVDSSAFAMFVDNGSSRSESCAEEDTVQSGAEGQLSFRF